MHALSRIALTLVTVFALASCVEGEQPGLLDGGAPTDDVDWENYSSDVRTRIDSPAASADCATLQAEFDNAEANNDAQRERTGDGNADLMAYIDVKISEAGCYG